MKKAKAGLSLIELVCVLAIVAIVLTLVLVGVQGVCESSRKLTCQNNLHQIGVALQNIVSKRGRFPDGLAVMIADQEPGDSMVQFVALLPELEQSAEQTLPRNERGTEADLPPKVLSCPSGGPFLGYRFNIGSGPSHRRERNGIMTLQQGIRAAEITDGLSNTAALSERLSGLSELNGVGTPKKVKIAVLSMWQTEMEFLTRCREGDHHSFNLNPGLDWRVGETWDTQYNHFTTPNPDGWDFIGLQHALLPAPSRHPGGVYLLLADGAVRWTSSGIDLAVWQALGTIANNESAVVAE